MIPGSSFGRGASVDASKEITTVLAAVFGALQRPDQ